MGLRLGGTDRDRERESIAVPVRLEPGLPAVLAHVELDEAEEIALILSQWRLTLEALRSGADGAGTMAAQLAPDPRFQKIMELGQAVLPRARGWAELLLKRVEEAKPLRKILIEEDVLGVYRFGPLPPSGADLVPPPNPRIELYWTIIGLVGQATGVNVGDLTGVVLAHELAHAYSHGGADIDGHRWPNSMYAAAEVGLREGLAQYYTHQVCIRLSDQHPGMLAAYKAVLEHQPAQYKTHLPWTKEATPEEVRAAIIESRRRGVTTLEEFNVFVEATGERWRG
jgi:hypothetical protein